MRVLLAFEEAYRVYMSAMEAAIRQFRPEVEVRAAAAADAEQLEAEVERFEPHLVICSPPVPENPVEDRIARIELSSEPSEPSRFRVGKRAWESVNPTLGEILPVIEETKKLLRSTSQEAAEGQAQ
jgi:hypothetical protein